MKYLDVSIQTIIVFVALVALIFSFEEQGWLTPVLVAQFLMGTWQLLSSAISVGMKAPFHKAKKWHLGISLVYLVVLYAIGFKFLLIIIVPFWTLAFYYYFITWKWVLHKVKKRSRFLPNLGF